MGPYSTVHSLNIGKGCRVWSYVNIMSEATIGVNCNICDRCFIENNVIIGDNVTIKTGVSLWSGLIIEDGVFIGPGVQFCNDKYPKSKNYVSHLPTILKQDVVLVQVLQYEYHYRPEYNDWRRLCSNQRCCRVHNGYG